jgi:hypothetical protein
MATNKFLTIVGNAVRLVQAVVSSAGPSDANKLISTNSGGVIDPSLLPAGVELQVQAIQTTENLSAGNFVNIYLDAGNKRCRLADASNNRPANGYVIAAFTLGNPANVYFSGKNSALTGLTAGVQFLSATIAGTSTATAPSAAGTLRQSLGNAISATELTFEYNEPIYIDA